MDDDQAPICIPCHFFHPVACRTKLVVGGGNGKVEEELVGSSLWLVSVHWTPMDRGEDATTGLIPAGGQEPIALACQSPR